MSKLLVVQHTPSPGTREVLEAVLSGAKDPEKHHLGEYSLSTQGAS